MLRRCTKLSPCCFRAGSTCERKSQGELAGVGWEARCEGVNKKPNQATAPGNETRMFVKPKYMEKTSARSGVSPKLPNNETIASSRRPQPPTVNGTSATPTITANSTAASAGDKASPCAWPSDHTAAMVKRWTTDPMPRIAAEREPNIVA